MWSVWSSYTLFAVHAFSAQSTLFGRRRLSWGVEENKTVCGKKTKGKKGDISSVTKKKKFHLFYHPHIRQTLFWLLWPFSLHSFLPSPSTLLCCQNLTPSSFSTNFHMPPLLPFHFITALTRTLNLPLPSTAALLKNTSPLKTLFLKTYPENILSLTPTSTCIFPWMAYLLSS